MEEKISAYEVLELIKEGVDTLHSIQFTINSVVAIWYSRVISG